ncbi:hypothetical protein NQ315_014212 [Exocentrus adspersus]|uniref:SAM domain-containing protein n=1 Tax=Exocentrus adspersus TaxID=1586481 RepID=A0AAV8VBS8_9CUCU|nr:hypothetical protein NQ315_014212 [Exocentrus adspersus]
MNLEIGKGYELREMSSITSSGSSELSIIQEEMDNSKITINTNSTKLILENNSSDVTISKYEAASSICNVATTTNNSAVTMKTQVVPLVYIPNSGKIPFPAANKTNSNVIVNNLPQLHFATLGTTVNKNGTNLPSATTVTLPTNQNVIFATGRPQPLVFQKPQANVVPIVPVSTANKITGTYLTMIKPAPNPTELPAINKMQLSSTLSTGSIPKMQDFPLLNNNSYIQPQNQAQKFVITPMPKITTNRLPATVTTNSVQPKIALLPMPVPSTEPSVTKQKIYNFKISEGQLQSDSTSTVTVIMDVDSNNSENNLVCDEIIDLNSPEKTDTTNKTYELSITEDSVSCHSDLRINNCNTDNTIIIKQSSNTEVKAVPHKDTPKFPKHGISILKKNYSNFPDRKADKQNNLGICNINSKNSVSDNGKEVSVIKSCAGNEEDVIITIPSQPAKPEKERRRKSHFSYRKEFDDMEVTTTSSQSNVLFPSEPNKPSVKKKESRPKKCLTAEIEIEVIKEKNDIKCNKDFDINKLLMWEDEIGTLPGSNLKFIMNEFNIIEYITETEYKKIIEKKSPKPKDKTKVDFQEEMRCLECGCFVTIVKRYHRIEAKKRNWTSSKRRKRNLKKDIHTDIKSEIKSEIRESGSDEDSNDNSSHEKFMNYPWACKKKGFSWSKYLDHIKAKPAPVKLFKDPFPYSRNGFRPGMKLEGVDPQHPSHFCVLTVAETVGYRLRLHFDGYPDNYDFWCNADSMDIFPMGWCEKFSHVLQPPVGYTVDTFNWIQYLKQTKSTAAPKHLFANRAGQAICPNGFRIGMKLEAVDRKNTSLVCVATVRDMMDNRILVHFDSWDDIYDYWADPTSPYIHPVGWCDQYGHNLTPPNDHPNPESFSWEAYLKQTKAVAAPVRAFKQRPSCGFKRGMRLECVDKRVPQLIRVATVDDVKEHQIRIHFDGWPDRYSYWVDDDSPDIHPMGWCQKTGHPIEPPLTPDDVYDFLECPTVGCKGQGHTKGPKYATHSSQKYCPYAEENIDAERVLPDRLLSPDRSPEAVVPVSREPKECKTKPSPPPPPRLGRPPKCLRLEQSKPRSPSPEEPPEKKPCKIEDKPEPDVVMEETEQKAALLIEESKVLPAERESWHRHSHFLKKYVSNNVNPRSWTNNEVIKFISSLPCCESHVNVFRRELIDGEALLSLSQRDILSLLKFKVGPGIKLYNSIVLLRHHVEEIFTS